MEWWGGAADGSRAGGRLMAGIWTQTDADTLKAAIATGVLTVRYDGPPARQVTYHSMAEMRSLLSSMLQDIAAQSGAVTSYTLAATRKGFRP